jgi:hypothetical protein
VFIYGSVDNIPEEVITEVKHESGEGNKVIGLLSGVANVV